MPSKNPPLSIRPGPERLARIDAYASEHKLSRHLAILLMLDEGYRSLTGTIKTPVSSKVVNLPPAMTEEQMRPIKGLVSGGRPPVPYGSRLKKR